MRTPWSGIWTWLDVTRQLCSVAIMSVTPSATVSAEGRRAALAFRWVRGGRQSKDVPGGLNETRQVRRLDARRTGSHVQFHPVGEHEAHPGAAFGRRSRHAQWYLWPPIEPQHNLGQRHAGFLQFADVDESLQVRWGIVRSAPCPERRGQEAAL